MNEYDEDYHVVPGSIEFVSIPNDLEEKLINNRKSNIKNKKYRNDWKVHAFDISQQNSKNAKSAIENFYKTQLENAKDERNNLNDQMNALNIKIGDCEDNRKRQKIEKEFKIIQKQWIDNYVVISNMEYDITNYPVFHPRDSIIGLIQINKKRCNQNVQYFALVKY